MATPEHSMMAVVTTGHGGYEKLDYRVVAMPEPGPGEVLVRVSAAGVNNTDINTRLGWYAPTVTAGTNATTAEEASTGANRGQGWNRKTRFPLIQGTDCCGRVAAVGTGTSAELIGSRVLVRACMRVHGFGSSETVWMGSDFDGAFAQYVKVPAAEVFAVECDWSDEELATLPCAYATAENMLHRAGVGPGEHVVVSGASGGVGSAVVQLAKRRGAEVTGIAGARKRDAVRAIGADRVIDRDSDVVEELGERVADIVVDNVAGPGFPAMLRLLRPGGRYVSSGAIAGPVVSLDMRDLYLKDIHLIGCTAWDEPVFPNLISYVERGQIRPLLAKVFPLERIADAQREFLLKEHVGNFVLVPAPDV